MKREKGSIRRTRDVWSWFDCVVYVCLMWRSSHLALVRHGVEEVEGGAEVAGVGVGLDQRRPRDHVRAEPSLLFHSQTHTEKEGEEEVSMLIKGCGKWLASHYSGRAFETRHLNFECLPPPDPVGSQWVVSHLQPCEVGLRGVGVVGAAARLDQRVVVDQRRHQTVLIDTDTHSAKDRQR